MVASSAPAVPSAKVSVGASASTARSISVTCTRKLPRVRGMRGFRCATRRPARGHTSGMKSAANGGLNISIPDGWWCEAEGLGENGWSIGRGEMYENPDEQDVVESEMLYELLEQEIIPMFYERGTDDLPRRWVMRMKNAMRTINPVFNTCLLYTSPSPRDRTRSRMPSSA